MIFFGHIAVSAGLAQAWPLLDRRHARARADLRVAAVVGLLPDVIDKPLALLFPSFFGYHTHLFGHSLVFALALFTPAAFAFGRRLGPPTLLSLLYLAHLLCDRAWSVDPDWFFWPFLGSPHRLDPIYIRQFFVGGFPPFPRISELAGACVVAWLVFRYGLYRPRNLKMFLRTGELTRKN